MPRVQPHQQVLVTFQAEGEYPLGDESIFFAIGTQIIGEWSSEQPGEPSTYLIQTDRVEWELEAEDVIIYSPLPALPPLMQLNLARAHESEAKQAEHQEDPERAATLYSCALAEYTLAGESDFKRATLGMTRGSMLARSGRYNESIRVLDQVARTCEQEAYNPANRRFNSTQYLDYAEHAAAALEGLGSVYLLQGAGKITLRRVIERLNGINTLIRKRYEAKVGILLELAYFSFEVGEQQEAAAYLAQADRFYQQQLAKYTDDEDLTWTAKRLQELKALIQPGTGRMIVFTITADTPDEMRLILAAFQRHVPELEVPKRISSTAPNNPRSGVRYTARVRLTVSGK